MENKKDMYMMQINIDCDMPNHLAYDYEATMELKDLIKAELREMLEAHGLIVSGQIKVNKYRD